MALMTGLLGVVGLQETMKEEEKKTNMNPVWTEEDCGLHIWDLMGLQLGDLCDMASGKMRRPMRSCRRADRFQGRVVASRNPKLVREAEEALTTKQRLASPWERRWPRTTQLWDMGEVSHQKDSLNGGSTGL
ncbi:uncharacterized protein AAGF69_016119 [Amazona ochrocephala]